MGWVMEKVLDTLREHSILDSAVSCQRLGVRLVSLVTGKPLDLRGYAFVGLHNAAPIKGGLLSWS
jgi:hypothetical protein